jgi:hypothetical protein
MGRQNRVAPARTAARTAVMHPALTASAAAWRRWPKGRNAAREKMAKAAVRVKPAAKQPPAKTQLHTPAAAQLALGLIPVTEHFLSPGAAGAGAFLLPGIIRFRPYLPDKRCGLLRDDRIARSRAEVKGRVHLIRGQETLCGLCVENYSSPTRRTARKASCGISTRPMRFMRFLPSFCFSRSLRLRVMSPP